MVRKGSGVQTLSDLQGASVCVVTGTTTELNLADQFAAAGVSYEAVVFEDFDSPSTPMTKAAATPSPPTSPASCLARPC